MSDNIDDVEWYDTLRSRLFYIFDRFNLIKDNKMKSKIIDSNIKTLWADCFTSSSYNPKNNYEKLEFGGDKFLGAAFSAYLIRKYPKKNQGFYSEAVAMWLSAEKLYIMADYLGITDLLRIAKNVDINIKIKTDLFESFCGALYFASDTVASGLGYAILYNLVQDLFENPDIKFNPSEIGDASPKTLIPQWFSNLDLEPPTYNVRESKNNKGEQIYTTTLSLNQKQIEKLNAIFNTNIEADKNGVIESEVSKTKRGAELLVYEKFYKYLLSKGINSKSIELEKIKSTTLPYGDIGEKALDKSRRDGFIGLKFVSSGKTTQANQRLVSLIGVREEDNGTLSEELLQSNTVTNIKYSKPIEKKAIHENLLMMYYES